MSVTPKRHADWSQTLVASAAYLVADHQSTFPSTPVRLPDAPAYAFFLNVTVAQTDASDTLDVFIETTLDGGTTYVAVGHFGQVAGNAVEGVATQHYLKIVGGDPEAGWVGAVEVALSTARDIMGDLWRIRTDIVEATAAMVQLIDPLVTANTP